MPLIFGRDGDAFVVVASLGGAAEHAGWFRNLAADPLAVVQVKEDRVAVRARIAAGEEREGLWKLMVEVYPAYTEYQSRTSRELPVVRLDRR